MHYINKKYYIFINISYQLFNMDSKIYIIKTLIQVQNYSRYNIYV